MFPIAKTNSGKYFTNKNFEYADVVLPVNEADVSSVTLVGNGVCSTFNLKKYTNVDASSGELLITDNNGGTYNKTYYKACGNDGVHVSSGDTWRAETEYIITT